jgi:hypothetical protein
LNKEAEIFTSYRGSLKGTPHPLFPTQNFSIFSFFRFIADKIDEHVLYLLRKLFGENIFQPKFDYYPPLLPEGVDPSELKLFSQILKTLLRNYFFPLNKILLR